MSETQKDRNTKRQKDKKTKRHKYKNRKTKKKDGKTKNTNKKDLDGFQVNSKLEFPMKEYELREEAN